MEIKDIKIDLLKPDSNQPRNFIDAEKVRELSVSIKNEGLINPVETDSRYVIVTGEMRWRAAKLAGLKEVSVKILEDEKAEGMPRFIRQMQENVHHNTMSVIDTAKALKKIAEWMALKPLYSKHAHPKNHATALSKLFGLSAAHIGNLLKLLDEPEEIQELLKKKNKFSASVFVEVRHAPERYQAELKKKAIAEGLPRDGVRYLANRLKELDSEENYKFANELLKRDFSGLGTPELIAEAGRVSQGVSFVNSDKEMVEHLERLTNETIALLESKPMSLLEGLNQNRVKVSLTLFVGILVEYLANEQKRIEVGQILKLRK